LKHSTNVEANGITHSPLLFPPSVISMFYQFSLKSWFGQCEREDFSMQNRKSRAFTLVEVMIVLAIISIVVAIAAPTWFRQREIARANACQENLAKIDQSLEQYALENKLPNGAPINFPADLMNPSGGGPGSGYLKQTPTCPAGGTYTATNIGSDPECSVGFNNSPFAPHTIQ
jgi:prepilin-type N-terminal cleavage/methylation domain-containing protein